MPAFRAAIEALGVQHPVDLGGAWSGVVPAAASKGGSEGLGIRAAALEAGAMTSGQRGRLIEKEQLGIALAPDVAVAALEFEPAADP